MPPKATNTDAPVNVEYPRRSTRISAQGEQQLPASRAKRPADGVNDPADAPGASKKVGTDKPLSTNLAKPFSPTGQTKRLGVREVDRRDEDQQHRHRQLAALYYIEKRERRGCRCPWSRSRTGCCPIPGTQSRYSSVYDSYHCCSLMTIYTNYSGLH
jgi:hypothetical protein